MGHNVSQAKRDSLAQDARIRDLVRYVVPGWRLRVEPERLEADPSLLGALQRGQELTFRCMRDECGRRIIPDLEDLVRAGQGHLVPRGLGELLQCRHPLGCRLKLTAETYPRGVPLISLLGDQGALVSVKCTSCSHTITLGPAAMIDRLKAAKRGDGSTGVLELAGRIRGPCSRCRSRSFITSIVRPYTSRPAGG